MSDMRKAFEEHYKKTYDSSSWLESDYEDWKAAWRASALACAAACEQYVTHSEVNKAHECEDSCRMIAEGK